MVVESPVYFEPRWTLVDKPPLWCLVLQGTHNPNQAVYHELSFYLPYIHSSHCYLPLHYSCIKHLTARPVMPTQHFPAECFDRGLVSPVRCRTVYGHELLLSCHTGTGRTAVWPSIPREQFRRLPADVLVIDIPVLRTSTLL